jgi:hypothetical protein
VLLKAEHEWAGYDLAVVVAQGRAVAHLECKSSSSHESGDAPFEIPHPVFTLPLSDQEPGEQGNRSRRRRARVNEITPLTGRDFIARDGIPMMRIRAETNKTRKSRMVRLHSHLIEQGLLAYAKSRAWARCSTIPLAVAAEVMSIRTTKKSAKGSRSDPRRTTAMKKHNHSSDDRPIQYRGKYSRHSRGQALTNFASDRHTGATCLKPSRRTIEAPAPAPSSLVSLSLN